MAFSRSTSIGMVVPSGAVYWMMPAGPCPQSVGFCSIGSSANTVLWYSGNIFLLASAGLGISACIISCIATAIFESWLTSSLFMLAIPKCTLPSVSAIMPASPLFPCIDSLLLNQILRSPMFRLYSLWSMLSGLLSWYSPMNV